MLELINKLSDKVLLFLTIRTDTLKIIIDENLKRDLENIKEIVFSENNSFEDIAFLKSKMGEYKWGDYSRWNPIYQNALKSLKEEYKRIHRDICHLLYD